MHTSCVLFTNGNCWITLGNDDTGRTGDTRGTGDTKEGSGLSSSISRLVTDDNEDRLGWNEAISGG